MKREPDSLFLLGSLSWWMINCLASHMWIYAHEFVLASRVYIHHCFDIWEYLIFFIFWNESNLSYEPCHHVVGYMSFCVYTGLERYIIIRYIGESIWNLPVIDGISVSCSLNSPFLISAFVGYSHSFGFSSLFPASLCQYLEIKRRFMLLFGIR